MSQQNAFFKPTTKYNEFLLLELLHSNPTITQRQLCKELSLSVAAINDYLKNMVSEGYLVKKRISYKNVHYNLSDSGIRRKNYLKINYFNSIQYMYRSSKEDVLSFLKDIVGEEPRKLILYGAGEVAELLLEVLSNGDNTISIVAILDDDETEQNKTLHGFPVIDFHDIDNYVHDGILIASYTHHSEMIQKLKDRNYNSEKIYQFFGN